MQVYISKPRFDIGIEYPVYASNSYLHGIKGVLTKLLQYKEPEIKKQNPAKDYFKMIMECIQHEEDDYKFDIYTS